MRRHLSYANVTASLALFVALGGSAYAAATIGGADVRNGSLTGADVRNGSLTSSDLRDRSVRLRDLARDARAAGPRGAVGPAGPKGDPGAPGPQGPQGVAAPAARWFLLGENGELLEQSGGFRVVSRPGTNGQPTTNPNVYVDAGSTLVGAALQGTVALYNRVDRDANGTPDVAFDGDVSVGRCASPGIECVPAGTNVPSTLVVRALQDNANGASQTRRAYVSITG